MVIKLSGSCIQKLLFFYFILSLIINIFIYLLSLINSVWMWWQVDPHSIHLSRVLGQDTSSCLLVVVKGLSGAGTRQILYVNLPQGRMVNACIVKCYGVHRNIIKCHISSDHLPFSQVVLYINVFSIQLEVIELNKSTE